MRGGHPAVVAVLVGSAAYPVAVALPPPTGPGAWSLVVACLAAVAAAAGAGAARVRGSSVPWVGSVALFVGGASAEVLAGVLPRVVAGEPVDRPVVTIATVVAGFLVAGGWAGGNALAARMDDVVERSAPPGHLEPVGHPLLVMGCLVLAAAGWARWVSPPGAWPAALVPLAVVLHAVVGLLHHQRLRRAALLAAWQRSGRILDPAVARNWSIWVAIFLVGGLGVVALWWTPPAEPLRRAAEEASPQAAARFSDYFDRQRLSREGLPGGGVTGESMPAGIHTPADADRRVVTIHDLSDWLLRPGTGFEEGEPPVPEGSLLRRWSVTPQLIVTVALLGSMLGVGYAWLRRSTRRGGSAPLTALVSWLGRLRAALAAMFGRRHRGAVPHPESPSEGADADGPRRRPSQWRRPANPRDQVKHDYLRLLDRAERRGLPRHRAQSPREYARALHPALPEHVAAVDEITGHFVEARYSHHPVGTGTAERTKELSRTLRRALRGLEPTRRSGSET